MFQRDRLDGRPHGHVFFHWLLLLEPSIEARPADLGQVAHPLDGKTALLRRDFSDLVVDAFSPEPSLFRRRASTFCQAPLEKSTSSILFPS
jgi:hypothetical protein